MLTMRLLLQACFIPFRRLLYAIDSSCKTNSSLGFTRGPASSPVITTAFLIMEPASFNPDSAVPADAMSEEQTFRSERSLSLRLIRLRRKWVSASERTSIMGGST